MTTTPTTLTPRRPPLADGIFYPETDGMPLPDGSEQEPHYREIVSILELRFAGPTTMVSGNTFIYYVEGNPRKSLAPDCYVAFDVSMESIELYNTYLAWKVGKMPDFVLEVGSPSTASNDVGPKRDLYASLGVREYWRFDPTGGDHYGEPLVGEYLVDGEYRRFETRREPDGAVRGHSPLLDLDLCWQEGRLRLYDPAAGRWLENYAELATCAAAERAARESAEARAAMPSGRHASPPKLAWPRWKPSCNDCATNSGYPRPLERVGVLPELVEDPALNFPKILP